MTGNCIIKFSETYKISKREIFVDILFLLKNTACIIILAIFPRSSLEEYPMITNLLYVTFSINSIYCINSWRLLFFSNYKFEENWDYFWFKE